MSEVYLVIRDQGEYSARIRCVEAVCSDKEKAITRAAKLAAAGFLDETTTWQSYWSDYFIQTWMIDGMCEGNAIDVTNHEILTRHPELKTEIEKRDKEYASYQSRLKNVLKK